MGRGVWGVGCGVWGVGYRVDGLKFLGGVKGSELRRGSGFRFLRVDPLAREGCQAGRERHLVLRVAAPL